MNLWNDARLRLTLTPLGFEYLAALSLVGVFAVNSGNNLLYLIFSLMLGLFVVSGWVSRRAIRGLEVLAIEEGSLFARVKGGVRVRLRDRHPRRLRGLEVHLAIEQGHVEPGFYGGGRKRGEPVSVVLQVRPAVRGWCRAGQLELRTRYPFGFLEKAWRMPVEKTLLVLPHPRSVSRVDDPEGEAPRSDPAPGLDCPDGARPFRTGDPPSRVHWKRTAQRGVPWIRTFEGERPAGLRLRLDLRAWEPGPGFEDELERLSGSVLQARLRRQEVSLRVETREGIRDESGPSDCWRALALAQAQGEKSRPRLPGPREWQ